MKIIHVAGARPNFMKIAPIMKELDTYSEHDQLLVHTGQHYDANMSQVFFDDLGMRTPDIHLNIGSGSHAQQTAAVMIAFEKVCIEHKPDAVLVVGDVNSTVAASLVCAKLWIPCVHVEAGLRSRDLKMPEEINRLVTDRLADLLLTPSPDGDENLLAEGVAAEKILCVGNIMIDTLLDNCSRAQQQHPVSQWQVKPDEYAVLTLHRPSNVDDPETFGQIIAAIQELSANIPMVFPVHPRTRSKLESFALDTKLIQTPGVKIIEPLGYLPFMSLTSQAKLVLTDSGGLQEETTALGIPCITIRENTERPITVSEGTNVLTGANPQHIIAEAKQVLEGNKKKGSVPKLWDGKTAQRIVAALIRRYSTTVA